MSLVPVKNLLEKAEREGYAVGAFNCNNMEIVQAIVDAAEAEKSPLPPVQNSAPLWQLAKD
jgi:fructose-bisphosphate aldolase class II